jgi:geranylgeranyl diphosphate synthase, type II
MMQKINIENYLKDKAGVFEKGLNEFLESDKYLSGALSKPLREPSTVVSKTLSDAMAYSLLAGGKRLRPVLAMSSWDLLNNLFDKNNTNKDSYKQIMPFALALEMIHTYSLIHDDLPCMDDDDLRRGKPSNHKVYGEAVAVLSGDALLTEAFNQIASLSEYYEASNVCKLVQYVSKASGAQGMVGGQVLDIENAEEDKVSDNPEFNKDNKGVLKIDLEYLKNTSYYKTGALIKASVAGPAILLTESNDNDKKLISDLEAYATAIGLAFQVVDDVLGVTSTKEKLGKSINIDEDNNKVSFASLLGIDGAKKLAKEEVEKAKDFLSSYSDSASVLLSLADYIVDRSF